MPAYKDFYPTPSAKKTETKEEGVINCNKCGFPCRTIALIPKGGRGNARPPDQRHRVFSRVGKGTEAVLTTVTLDDGSGTVQKYIPTVNAGCPMCGTYLFDKHTRMPDNNKDPEVQERVQKPLDQRMRYDSEGFLRKPSE